MFQHFLDTNRIHCCLQRGKKKKRKRKAKASILTYLHRITKAAFWALLQEIVCANLFIQALNNLQPYDNDVELGGGGHRRNPHLKKRKVPSC